MFPNLLPSQKNKLLSETVHDVTFVLKELWNNLQGILKITEVENTNQTTHKKCNWQSVKRHSEYLYPYRK